MVNFWRTQRGLARFRLALGGLRYGVQADITEIASGVRRRFGLVGNSSSQRPKSIEPGGRPVIFASACVDASNPGGWKYNGGIKELNYLVRLLCSRGFEAYLVTYDGTYEPWLIDHAPTLSLSQMTERARTAKAVRYITSWAWAEAFLGLAPSIYFWDMELGYTDNRHFAALASLYRSKIVRTAAISRTIQAWHMAYFGRPTTVIPNLIDTSRWKAQAQKKRPKRVGYMNEGSQTTYLVQIIAQAAKKRGVNVELYLIAGDEAVVLAAMQTCTVFVSFNQGKDPLWGEGCPRTILEAMAAGCVSVSFDIIGNRETVISGFNGVIVPSGRSDLLAAAVIDLLTDSDRLKEIQTNTEVLMESVHTLDSRWPSVAAWLNLRNVS